MVQYSALSILPGLSNAGSIKSGRLLAAKIYTPTSCIESMSVS